MLVCVGDALVMMMVFVFFWWRGGRKVPEEADACLLEEEVKHCRLGLNHARKNWQIFVQSSFLGWSDFMNWIPNNDFNNYAGCAIVERRMGFVQNWSWILHLCARFQGSAANGLTKVWSGQLVWR